MVSICIDPNDGGATHVLGLMRDYPRVMHDPYAMPTFTQLFWSPSAVATLAAGYVGSAVVGFVLVVSIVYNRNSKLTFSSAHVGHISTSPTANYLPLVHIVASKVCALVLHFGMLVPVLRADHWM